MLRPQAILRTKLTFECMSPKGGLSVCFQELDQAADIATLDFEKRRVLMADIEAILQSSGIIIQPFWRKLYNHTSPQVKGMAMHPTFCMSLEKAWLDA